MKKKLVLILLLLAASTGYASTIGNPKPLGDKRLAVTVEPNFMHDRDIKAEGGRVQTAVKLTPLQFLRRLKDMRN
jgi:prolyl-tRNA editing enzyme YbaK/EbsC (Cys-tRNA(Pro) deacylase)